MEGTSGRQQFQHWSLLVVATWSLCVLALNFWPYTTLLDRFEWRTVDWRFRARGPQPPAADDHKITIVAVDEPSLRQVGRWPWPRQVFAELIRKIARAGARAIVFDVFFIERDQQPGGAASDTALVRATREAGNVYHAGFIAASQQARPLPPLENSPLAAWQAVRLQQAEGLAAVAELIEPPALTLPWPELIAASRAVGLANVLDSGDGIYRHLVPLVRYKGRIFPSLALAVAADWLGVRPEQIVVVPGREINLGGQRRLPLDVQGRFLIDFLGGDHTYEYVSAARVLQADDETNRTLFRQGLVLIGVTAPGIYDLRANPFSTAYNGVEAEASAVDAILSSRFLHQPSPLWMAFFVGLLIPLYGIVFPRLPASWMTFAGFVGPASYPWLAVALFIRQRLLVPFMHPLIALLGSFVAIVVLRLLIEERRRSQTQHILRTFVPPQVADRLLEDETEAMLRGERREISVLFADLRNFTATADTLAPEDIVTFLNRYFSLMHEIIWEHEGTLDKYVGDEIMVLFNAPALQPDHAHRAVMTAIDMQRRIQGNQAEWEFLQVPNLAAGIGIATGPAVVGYIGSSLDPHSTRMQYTAIGATVNLASRLQALCKPLGCRILISDATYRAVADLIVAQDLGALPIAGFHEPLRVWNVLDYREAALRGHWEPVGRPIDLALVERLRASQQGNNV